MRKFAQSTLSHTYKMKFVFSYCIARWRLLTSEAFDNMLREVGGDDSGDRRHRESTWPSPLISITPTPPPGSRHKAWKAAAGRTWPCSTLPGRRLSRERRRRVLGTNSMVIYLRITVLAEPLLGCWWRRPSIELRRARRVASSDELSEYRQAWV